MSNVRANLSVERPNVSGERCLPTLMNNVKLHNVSYTAKREL